MASKDIFDDSSESVKKLIKSDPGQFQLQRNIYKRFQIFWKNVRPRSTRLVFLTTEYADYEIISKRNSFYDLLIDSIMELYLESMHKNKSKTIAIFSHDLGATPYYENFWSLQLDELNHNKDNRVRVRKKLSLYKEISEGLLKHVLPYVVTCLAIVQNNANTDFEKNTLLKLGNLIYIISQSNYPALKKITNTKTGLSVNDLRNASAHSSVRTFPNDQIELTLEKKSKKKKINVKEKDIDEDIQYLADIVFIIKFSISLFVTDHVQDLRGKLVPISRDLQPEDACFYLFNCFAKFQYGVESIPVILDSLISIRVKSLITKSWKDILVELSIHLPAMRNYLKMINKGDITKIKIIGSNYSGDEVGFVELSLDSINRLVSGKQSTIDAFNRIKFFNAKKNLLDSSFNDEATKLIKSEEEKIVDLKKLGLID